MASTSLSRSRMLAQVESSANCSLAIPHSNLSETCPPLKFFLSRRPAKIPSPQQMQMKMKHGLPSAAPVVEHGAVAVGQMAILGKLGGGQLQFAEHGDVVRRGFGQRIQMLPGTQQDMHRCLRLNILKREYFGVFVHQLRRNFPAADFAEQAIVHKKSFLESAAKGAIHQKR